MAEHDDFYRAADLPLGARVHGDGRTGSIVRRAARLWIDRDSRPPMVRWDGKVDAEVVSWQELLTAVTPPPSDTPPTSDTTTGQTAETGVPADGYCPKCFALEDEACQTSNGAARPDHAARHHHVAGGCTTTFYGPAEEGFPSSSCTCERSFGWALAPLLADRAPSITTALDLSPADPADPWPGDPT